MNYMYRENQIPDKSKASLDDSCYKDLLKLTFLTVNDFPFLQTFMLSNICKEPQGALGTGRVLNRQLV